MATSMVTRRAAPKVEALARIPYLRGLPARELAGLAARCVLRQASRGATIFAEGAPATGLWVILSGRVKLVRTSRRGREQVLHVESSGATLAEVPVFDGGGYVASAVAAEDARLLFVPRAAVIELCLRRPQVALGIIEVLSRRVRAFASLIEDLALRDVTGRVAGFLVSQARRGGGDVVLRGTRDEIAAQLGTVRELVSRSLSRLASRGLIEVRGRRVHVRDPRRLSELAEEAAL
jgi:CRP/FNR family transcriptional regulator